MELFDLLRKVEGTPVEHTFVSLGDLAPWGVEHMVGYYIYEKSNICSNIDNENHYQFSSWLDLQCKLIMIIILNLHCKLTT